jgi:hypothetical protein
MVALGLILEYGAIIARTGHSKRNGPAFAWIQVFKVFTILGGLFITIGVAGELVAESGIAVAEGKLRQHNNDVLIMADLTLKIGLSSTDTSATLGQLGLSLDMRTALEQERKNRVELEREVDELFVRMGLKPPVHPK